MKVSEIREWLATLDANDHVGIDDGGLRLKVFQHSDPYLEIGGMPEDAEQRAKEIALEDAAEAQMFYWDALRALEHELDIDLDEFSGELDTCTVEYLKEEYGNEEGESDA